MARFDGTAGNDVLTGTMDNDELFGYEGEDTLNGGPGDDYLNPGDNDSWDQILGSTGNDTIVFTDNTNGNQWLDYTESDFQAGIEATIDGETNTATVDKGAAGTDTIVDIVNALEAYGGFSLYGTGLDDVYNLTLQSGQWMEVLGNAGNDTFNLMGGGTVRLDYRYVDNAVHINLSEGRAYDDGFGDVDTINGAVQEVRGTDYSDVIVGSNNNETFIGRLGDDTIDGGGGFDRLRFDRSGVGDIQVDLEAGTATGTWNEASFSYTISSIEYVRGGSGNDEIRGGRGSERLDGGGGDDTLIGGAGNDTLRGDAGADLLDGGAGNYDVISYTNSNAGVSVNLATGVGSGGHAEGDTISGFERVWGSSHNDTLTGDDGDNLLWGGAGADRIDGGTGEDWAAFDFTNAGVSVNLATGVGSGGHAEGDTISGIEKVIGSSYDDTLVGDGGDNTLHGGQGADHLEGRAGNDVVSYSRSDAAVEVNLATGVVSGGSAEGDTISGFEGALGSSHADTLIGDGGDNTLYGIQGDDLLAGRAGGDVLEGGEGNDRLWGGGGNDFLSGDGGDDLLHGHTGDDTLEGGTDNDTLAGQAGRDELYGGTGDDRLWGGGGDDILDGGEGNDLLVSHAGDDELHGGAGNDTLAGQDDDDALYGGADNDRLFGGAGNDTLDGGEGNDFLVGGGGADAFVFSGASGIDTLYGFTDGEDLIDLSAYALSDFGAVNATQVGDDVRIDLSAHDGGTIMVRNVDLADLDGGDFLF